MRPLRGKRRRSSAESGAPSGGTTATTATTGTNTPSATSPPSMRRRGPKPSGVQIITRYMCRYCGQQFDNMNDMNNHTSVHNGERAPHSCFVCGKTYRTPSKLQRHVRVHSGERPYSCTVCGKRFTRSDHVKQHMKVHLPQKQKNVCRMCGMRFVRRQTLHDHLRGHGVSHVSSCNRCGEAFESVDMLQQHKAQHETLGILAFPDDSLDGRVKLESGLASPILGLAKFGLGPQPDVRESLDGVIKPESNNPAADVARALNGDSHEDGDREESPSALPTIEVENAEEEEESGEAVSEAPPMSIAACFSLASALGGGSMPGLEELRSQTLAQDHVIVLPTSPSPPEERTQGKSLRDMIDTLVSRSINGVGKPSSQEESRAAASGGAETQTADQAPEREGDRESLLASFCSPPVFPESSLSSAYGSLSEASPEVSAAINAAMAAASGTTTANSPALSPSERPSPPENGGMSRRSKRFKGSNSYPKQSRVSPPCEEVQMELEEDAGVESQPGTPPEASSLQESGGMHRCHHCCIWFEDHVMFALHQNLHRADRLDPFTCKKCLKKLGNRLEFQAHIIWHLDPFSVYSSP